MKYLMLVCVDPTLDPAAVDPDEIPIEQWVDEHDASGARVLGNRVRPALDATTVRVRRGELLVTDGPFGETKEQIAGFDVLDCKDLDHAIEIARQHSMARGGYLELRPFWEV